MGEFPASWRRNTRPIFCNVYNSAFLFYGAEIDECAEGTARCDHQCTNIDGGFNCSCFKGYTLNGDLRTCTTGMSIMLIGIATQPVSQLCGRTIIINVWPCPPTQHKG